MKDFQVNAERSNQWWVLVCDQAGAVGQCRRLDQADQTMREAIAYQSGLSPDAFTITVTPILPDEFTQLRQDADNLRNQALTPLIIDVQHHPGPEQHAFQTTPATRHASSSLVSAKRCDCLWCATATEPKIKPSKSFRPERPPRRRRERMPTEMRTEYDFTNSRPNPSVKRPRQQVTIRLDVATIDYFRQQAGQTGIPYQTLINLYLADCVASDRKPALTWA